MPQWERMIDDEWSRVREDRRHILKGGDGPGRQTGKPKKLITAD